AALVSATSWHAIAWIAIAVVVVAAVVWFTLAPLLRWRTTHFVVTTDRVMAREGIINRTGLDIPLSRINSVRFEHSLWDRLFGAGTLIIESASDDPLEFDDIPEVERVHTLLYREVDEVDDLRAGQYGHPQGYQPTQQFPPQPRSRRRR
ncbi:MAG: PH domain-containing protein, partial [Sciscionella sp.]|nr:PH domain-containing protein [Sciscionella sp.]